MKNNIAYTLAALAGAAILAGCGGGGGGTAAPSTTSASIAGTASGVPGPTLLLNNAGSETIAVSANGGFSFGKRVTEGSQYNVTVSGQPNGSSCVVANGTGTVAHDVESISNVSVACTSGFMTPWTPFRLGVTVSGLLSGSCVTFTNNGNETLAVSDNGLWLFADQYVTGAVYSGRAGGYEVAVGTQPAGQTCTVSNGSGAVTDSNFVDVLVSCK